MPPEVSEFTQIIDGDWPHPVSGRRPNEAELRGALQVMLTRQCVYSSTPGLSRTYELVKQYHPFFSRFFGSLGYTLVVSPRDQMVALQVPSGESRYDAVYERLKKDETIVLLALRLMWGEAIQNQDIGDGGLYESTTNELIERIRTITQQNPPSEARLDEILRLFSRHGAVRTGGRDRVERVSPLTILPGVAILVPDGYVNDLLLWSSAPPEEDRDSTRKAEPDEETED
jgi:hypothetical protein